MLNLVFGILVLEQGFGLCYIENGESMKSKIIKSELDLPAGSLDCALSAFENGADGVYLGLKSFSARASAVNFSLEDLSKLRASTSGKIYVTINTLLKASQLDEALQLCKSLDELDIDGLIVQDLGLARQVRRLFPHLGLQASTQLAVHTSSGVKALAGLGFSRVVLARELSLKEIETIRNDCPDVELKVFIHGALCYGFSGLCMASRIITGRSANCGACAQICRSWMDSPSGEGYWLSMRDLCAGPLAKSLSDMGIDALKVEGRMKSPLYTGLCARFYRHILDGEDSFYEADLQALRLAFDRRSTSAYLEGEKDLFNTDFPGHRGIQAGIIESLGRSSVTIRASRHLCNHDGLLCFKGTRSCQFAISGLKPFVSPGQRFTIDVEPRSIECMESGRPVFLVSDHALNSKSYGTEGMALYKKPIDIIMKVLGDRLEIEARGYRKAYEAPVSLSSSAGLEEGLSKVFSSGTFKPSAMKVIDENGPSFIPLSVLKSIRRDFYESLQDYIRGLKLDIPREAAFADPGFKLPQRDLLPMWDEVAQVDGKAFISLRPVLFCPGDSPLGSFATEQAYWKRIEAIMAENPGVIVGLNNVSQLKLAKAHPETRFFADVWLYCANISAFAALGLDAAYSWAEERPDIQCPAVFDPGPFQYPLFISRTCLRSQGLGLSCSSCMTRRHDIPLAQNGQEYVAKVRDCTTIIVKR